MDNEKLLEENHSLKRCLAVTGKSLYEMEAYANSLYLSYQKLRQQLSDEQVLLNATQALVDQLRLETFAIIDSHEAQLLLLKNNSIVNNNSTELEMMKKLVNETRAELENCQKQKADLQNQLRTCQEQFNIRFNDLNHLYKQKRKQHKHLLLCIRDFQRSLSSKKQAKTECHQIQTNERSVVDKPKDEAMFIEPISP